MKLAMNLRLQHIRAFEEVAQAKSFTRAARLLHITQSALSRQVRQLEDVLGVELLDRSTQRVELTAAGHTFKRECSAAWTQLEYAVHSARQAARRAMTLCLGFSDYVNVSPVGPLLDAYAELDAGVELVQQEFDDVSAWRALELREVDAIVVPTYEPIERANSMTITTSEHVAFVSRTHPAVGDEAGVSLERVGDAQVLLPSPSRFPACARYLLERLEDAGVTVGREAHNYSILTLMRLVGDGHTIFVGPQWYEQVMPEDVLTRSLQGVETCIPLSLVWYDPMDDAVDHFVSFAFESAEEIPGLLPRRPE